MRTAVSALHAFAQAVTDRSARLQTWRMGTDPCGAPYCMHNAQAPSVPVIAPPPGAAANSSSSSSVPSPPALCTWSGISCSSWRVVSIILPCRTTDASCTGLQGQLAGDALATMNALQILDLQARPSDLGSAACCGLSL
jgi:hypothetical protein